MQFLTSASLAAAAKMFARLALSLRAIGRVQRQPLLFCHLDRNRLELPQKRGTAELLTGMLKVASEKDQAATKYYNKKLSLRLFGFDRVARALASAGTAVTGLPGRGRMKSLRRSIDVPTGKNDGLSREKTDRFPTGKPACTADNTTAQPPLYLLSILPQLLKKTSGRL